MFKPLKVDDTFGSPNGVQTSQLSKQSMGMHITHQWMSLFMVIKLFKLFMRCNIYMVAFSEFAQEEMVLIARF